MRPDVRWHSSDTAAAEALETHAWALLGSGTVTSGRLCPACGSAAHGRPWVRHDGRPVHVSLSRSGPHLVTAIAEVPVGVDVEVAALGVLPELVLAPGETGGLETGDLARTWVRKEAILKARGTGLATAMSSVRLADDHGADEHGADEHGADEHWQDLDSPVGYVAALALALAPASPSRDTGVRNGRRNRRDG